MVIAREYGLEIETKAKKANLRSPSGILAEWTGLEPATPGVTGRYSNQLNYHSKLQQSGAARHKTMKLPD